MLTSSISLIKALERGKFTGVVLYHGRSLLDGELIVAIATRIASSSENVKTGSMVQTFVIRADVRPLDALKSGADRSVCGDCKHRPAFNGTCYVNVAQSVNSVFGAWERGRYAYPGTDYDADILADIFDGRTVRLGTYGDPAAVPVEIWRKVTAKAASWTGYTHQWRHMPELRPFCMASVDSEAEYALAKAQGWRTFRVRTQDAPVLDREVVCPASAEAGNKTVCALCKACGGTSSKARADIVIKAHGAKFKIARFENA